MVTSIGITPKAAIKVWLKDCCVASYSRQQASKQICIVIV